MPMLNPIQTPQADTSCGGRLVATDGRTLPLTAARLVADACGGIARVTLEQEFANPYTDPLSVTYLLPLPADGAVGGFSFDVGDETIIGEVDGRAVARERFEQAIIDGHSAGLLEQDRSSLFTQEIGNIPPKAKIVARVVIDQKLIWQSDGSWQWRFPVATAPRCQGADGRVTDAKKLRVDVADTAQSPRLSLTLGVRDKMAKGGSPSSESHAIRCSVRKKETEVLFVDEAGANLDRDVVVSWPVAQSKPGVTINVARPKKGNHADSAYGLLSVIPPTRKHKPEQVSRDLIVLLDTSGSMGGAPLDQAKCVVTALIDTLCDRDRLEMIEFSSRPNRWKKNPINMTARVRADAKKWIARQQAGGCTEMFDGIMTAMSSLRDQAQRQVLLITDGHIGFESEIVDAVTHRLPATCRVHTLGVGSSVNRSLLGPVARAGRGQEAIVGIDDSAEAAAQKMVAYTADPLVVNLAVTGDVVCGHAPMRLPDLYAGAPALLALELRPEGGELRLSGDTATGTWQQTLVVPRATKGQGSGAVCALYAREAVEDLELRVAAGEAGDELDSAIETLGVDFQISTRLTSWIAVSDSATVDPRDPTRHENVPHELPHGMSGQGVGLRAPMFGHAATMQSAAASYGGAPANFLAASSSRGIRGRSKKGAKIYPVAQVDDDSTIDAIASESSEFEQSGAGGRAGFAEIIAPIPAEIAGTLTQDKDGYLVVVFEPGADFEWSLDGAVSLVLDDGTIMQCTVVAKRSTRPGSIATGQRVKLVLQPELEMSVSVVQVNVHRMDQLLIINV